MKTKFTATQLQDLKYVEGLRDQGFGLPKVESLRFRVLWLLKKALQACMTPGCDLVQEGW